jgi:hypothetical protein
MAAAEGPCAPDTPEAPQAQVSFHRLSAWRADPAKSLPYSAFRESRPIRAQLAECSGKAERRRRFEKARRHPLPADLPKQGLQLRVRAKLLMMLVQLGGLEPPTSCSTDRRSNQLSYNCIRRAGPKRGRRTGRKLGATPVFGKAARTPSSAVSAADRVNHRPSESKSPGERPGLSCKLNLGRSGGRLEQLRRIGLDRFGGFRRDLLCQFAEFLGMRGEGLELLLGVRGP